MNQGHLLTNRITQYYGSLYTHRTRTAVVCGNHRYTWEQVQSRVNRLANALMKAGIGRGDSVAVHLKNGLEFIELVYSLAAIGAAAVPINYRFTPREVVYAVTRSGAKALVVSAEILNVAKAAHLELSHLPADRFLVVGDEVPPGWRRYEDFLTSGEDRDPAVSVSENDIFLLGFTGGTTDYPKCCMVPHRNEIHMWLTMSVEFGIGRDDISLISGPLYHGLSFEACFHQLYVGGTVVILEDFDPTAILSTVEREHTTVITMAPTMYTMLLNSPGADRYDVSTVKALISAGASLPTRTKEAILSFFPSAGLYEYYGATEAGFYTLLKPSDQLRKERSCGLPYFGIEIRVLDDNGNDLPTGQIGEIYKRGPVKGGVYYNNPEATAAMYRGEWATSGDMGYLDEEGYLYIVDRKKDMIITGGSNVYPSEIEAVILSHPDVQEVAVIGVPDELWGEAIKAFVVPRPGASLTEAEIVALCRQQLASYKKPRYVEFIAELPKSAAGKVLKRQLRERAAKG